MGDIKEFLNSIAFHDAVYKVFLFMCCVIAIKEITTKFCKAVGIRFKWIDKKDEQAQKIESLEKGQNELKEAVTALRKAKCVELWRDITRDGIECIERGTRSYSESAIFKSMYNEYEANFGNGHVKNFVECFNELPYTEEITPEQLARIKEQTPSRVAKAQAALSMYYVSHGVE